MAELNTKRLLEIDSWKFKTIPRHLYAPSGPMSVVIVGCGGTGSALVPGILRLGIELAAQKKEHARVNRLDYDETKHPIEVALIDPDYVEEKNLLRQNFCKSDVGKNKAQALADRYSGVFGQRIRWKAGRFSSTDVVFIEADYCFVISCVDSQKSRLEIAKFTDNYPWAVLIDSGNELTNGQVFLGVEFCTDENRIIQTKILEAHPNIERLAAVEQGPSCAERSMTGEQSFAINTLAAQTVINILSMFIRCQPINFYEVRFDTECGTERLYAADYLKNVRKRQAEMPKEEPKPREPEVAEACLLDTI